MSEPPSSTGAGSPSVPGSAKTPRLATMSGQPASGSSMSPFTQPGRGEHADLAVAERRLRVLLVAVLGRAGGLLHQRLHGLEALDRLRAGQGALPLVAVLDREVTPGVPDERDAVAPVLAREPEAGEVGRVGVGRLEVDGGLRRTRPWSSGPRCRPPRRGPCGRRCTSSRRSTARRTSCRRPGAPSTKPWSRSSPPQLAQVGAHVAERAGRGERRGLGVADLDHVRGLGVAGQRRWSASRPAPPTPAARSSAWSRGGLPRTSSSATRARRPACRCR